MVGTENNVSNYYNVSNGKVVRSFGKTKPDGFETTSRVNKNGDTVYEQNFDFIQGKIVNVSLDTHEEYGDHIKLSLSDGQSVAELQIKFDSSYGRSFLFKLPNFKYSDDVKIKPYSFVDKKDGRTVTGLNLLANNVKVSNYYTKDTPNGLPQLKKVKFNGKDQWDKTEQLEFLKAKFFEFSANFKEVNEVDSIDDINF